MELSTVGSNSEVVKTETMNEQRSCIAWKVITLVALTALAVFAGAATGFIPVVLTAVKLYGVAAIAAGAGLVTFLVTYFAMRPFCNQQVAKADEVALELLNTDEMPANKAITLKYDNISDALIRNDYDTVKRTFSLDPNFMKSLPATNQLLILQGAIKKANNRRPKQQGYVPQSIAMLNYLIPYCDLTKKNSRGDTLLSLACRQFDSTMVTCLLDKTSVDPCVTNLEGQNAYDIVADAADLTSRGGIRRGIATDILNKRSDALFKHYLLRLNVLCSQTGDNSEKQEALLTKLTKMIEFISDETLFISFDLIDKTSSIGEENLLDYFIDLIINSKKRITNSPDLYLTLHRIYDGNPIAPLRQLLLAKKITNIDNQDKIAHTMLYYAVQNNDKLSAVFLIQDKADWSIPDDRGEKASNLKGWQEIFSAYQAAEKERRALFT